MILLALFAVATPAAAPLPSWLAGYWLECTPGRETAETWSDGRGGMMLGTSRTLSRQYVSWEFARISPGPGGLRFHAYPADQPPAEFPAVEIGADRVVFENPAHDFPQRILYQRKGDALTARIEGKVEGRSRSVEWRYRLKPHNSRCPAPGG